MLVSVSIVFVLFLFFLSSIFFCLTSSVSGKYRNYTPCNCRWNQKTKNFTTTAVLSTLPCTELYTSLFTTLLTASLLFFPFHFPFPPYTSLPSLLFTFLFTSFSYSLYFSPLPSCSFPSFSSPLFPQSTT